MPTLDVVRRRQIGRAVGLVLAVGLFGLPLGPLRGPMGVNAAANCKLTLESGEATPASGTTRTEFSFSVLVSWKTSCPEPQVVTLTIVGLSGAATIVLAGGTQSTATGTTTAPYSGRLRIGSPGVWPYEFAARMTSSDPWATLAGSAPARITVSAPPTPTPKPTPTPTPKPKPKPKPTPTPTPKPKPKPTPVREPEPAATPTARAVPTPPPPESAEPAEPVTPEPDATDPPLPSQPEPAPTGDAPEATMRPLTAVVVTPPGGPHPPRPPGFPPASGPLPGGPPDLEVALVLLVWLASATAGSLLFAWALARRTERRDDPSLAYAMAPAAAPAEVTAATVAVDEQPIAVPDPEALIPRWRRPSLQAARQSRFVEDVPRLPLHFPPGAPVGDLRIVAYRLVFVSDRPDDVDGVELGRLDRGDEVDLIRLERGFALVQAPDGLRGWVVAATLEHPASDEAGGSDEAGA